MQAFNDYIVVPYNGGLTQAKNAACTVYLHGTSTKATIYSDNGTTQTSNPATTTSTGQLFFYAADGRYDIVVTGNGINSTTISDVMLEDPLNPNTYVINGGSIDNTPIGATTPSTGAFTTVNSTGAMTAAAGSSRPGYSNSTAIVSTSSFTCDGSLAQVFLITVTNTITLTFAAPTNIVAGAMYKFLLQAVDGATRTYAWNAAYKFPSATPPLTTGTTTAGAYDVISFVGGTSNTLIYDGKQSDVR